ncbi:hypothetical protein QE152_g16957 [Popillia japonica]|uniref:Uncharacterized protein n=1 Tax=Popillia japonica TaxID=7064 RepID=A0AAW1L711_POPJA
MHPSQDFERIPPPHQDSHQHQGYFGNVHRTGLLTIQSNKKGAAEFVSASRGYFGNVHRTGLLTIQSNKKGAAEFVSASLQYRENTKGSCRRVERIVVCVQYRENAGSLPGTSTKTPVSLLT